MIDHIVQRFFRGGECAAHRRLKRIEIAQVTLLGRGECGRLAMDLCQPFGELPVFPKYPFCERCGCRRVSGADACPHSAATARRPAVPPSPGRSARRWTGRAVPCGGPLAVLGGVWRQRGSFGQRAAALWAYGSLLRTRVSYASAYVNVRTCVDAHRRNRYQRLQGARSPIKRTGDR